MNTYEAGRRRAEPSVNDRATPNIDQVLKKCPYLVRRLACLWHPPLQSCAAC